MSRSTLPARTLISLLALSTFATSSAFAAGDAERVEELEQRLLVLERKLEIQQEEAATKAKEAVVPSASEKGFSLKKGDYEIKFNALAQIDGRFFLDDDGAFRDGFQARRLRPTIQGTLGKLVAFRFTPEFAGGGFGDASGNSIVDAYFDLKFSPYASVRVGKQKGPIGLERLQSGGSIELIERGFPTELVPNRDLGVLVYGEALQSTVSYSVGLFNGTADGRDVSTLDDGLKEVEGRIFLEPFKNEYGFFKGLGFGIAGSSGAKDSQPTVPTTANPANANATLARLRTPGQNTFFTYDGAGVFASGKHTRYSPQAYFYYNNLGLLGEYVVSEQDITRGGTEKSIKNDAYSITASYVLTGEDASYKGVKPSSPFTVGAEGWGAVEVVARFGELDVDNAAFAGVATGNTADRLANPEAQASKATSYGVGINWYLNSNAKLSADYNETSFDGGAAAGADRRDEKALFTRLTIQY